ncbi:MAG: putative phosphoenolpyruvate synthase [Methanomassiliicoccales archaeon PtaU1.Bin124]|nr:MAG: putative phosphoenolpyruvate synthase [Methanomassiliicoccales archaeon PtaU1.Bin124]
MILLELSKVGEQELGLTGGKAGNLANMIASGFDVPPGFVVPVTEYDRFIKDTGLDVKISALLEKLDFEDPAAVERTCRQIRESIVGHPARDELAKEIGSSTSGKGLWAVRSSAIAEDLADASFAGQQDTYLNVRPDSVMEHVRRCWASYWNERAVTYRHDNQVPQLRTGIAVLVQRMVTADRSGIMFTRDPVDGKEEVIIEASFGLGEAIASGIVTPDRYVCGENGKVRQRQVNRKQKAVFLAENKMEPVELEEARQNVAALNDHEAEGIAALGKRLETHFGTPQDVEWAMEGGKVFLLQSRPITTLTKDRTLWTRAYGDEYWADVTSPLFFSLLGEYLTEYVNREGSRIMGYNDLTGKDLIMVHKAHIYFNCEVLEEVFTYNPKFSRTKELLNYFPVKDQERIGNADTKLMKRVVAEVRIAVLDRDGMITRTYKAYDRWAKSFLEEMAPYDAMDLTRLSDAQLHEEFRKMEQAFLKHYRLIRYGMVTHSIGMNLIIKRWLESWLDDRSGELYSKVISGLKGNKTIETNIALAKLAAKANADHYVQDKLRTLPPAHFLKEMKDESAMMDFEKAFNDFLKVYGQRSHTREIYFPRWRDDPTMVVNILKALMDAPDLDLEKMEQEKVQERLQAEKDILDRIGRLEYGGPKKLAFKIVLHYAQIYLMFRENQRFYLDHQLYRLRRLFMEYGRRFKERGWVDSQMDIFFLSKEEIFAAENGKQEDMKAKIEPRKKDFERWKDKLPPKFVRGNAEFDDTIVWQGDVLKITGTSASPGTFTGLVRVVDTIEQLGQVGDDEILVTSNTDPGWTAVFSKIGGLITETGGILSHGAVVSREYGIPAVTAVKGATKIFKTGQRITLDGNEGTIYVSESD